MSGRTNYAIEKVGTPLTLTSAKFIVGSASIATIRSDCIPEPSSDAPPRRHLSLISSSLMMISWIKPLVRLGSRDKTSGEVNCITAQGGA